MHSSPHIHDFSYREVASLVLVLADDNRRRFNPVGCCACGLSEAMHRYLLARDFRSLVIADIVRQIGCSVQEATNLAGDIETKYEPMQDGFSPSDLATEILVAECENA